MKLQRKHYPIACLLCFILVLGFSTIHAYKPKVKEDIPIKEIDLDSQLNKLGETFLRMNKAEREVVKDLLRRSGLFDK